MHQQAPETPVSNARLVEPKYGSFQSQGAVTVCCCCCCCCWNWNWKLDGWSSLVFFQQPLGAFGVSRKNPHLEQGSLVHLFGGDQAKRKCGKFDGRPLNNAWFWVGNIMTPDSKLGTKDHKGVKMPLGSSESLTTT